MADLKICRICLQTESKVYNYFQYQLKNYYEEILALELNNIDSLPQYFCFQCAILLHKFHKFKEKCHFGQKILQEILWKGPITYDTISTVDRTHLQLLNKSNPQNVLFTYETDEQEVHSIDNIIIKEEDNNDETIGKIDIENENVDSHDNFARNNDITINKSLSVRNNNRIKSREQKVLIINETDEQEVTSIDNVLIKEEDKNDENTDINVAQYKCKYIDDSFEIETENLDSDDNFAISFVNRSDDMTVNDRLSLKKKNKTKSKNNRLKSKDRKCKDKKKYNENNKNSINDRKSDQTKEKIVKRLILMDVAKWKKFDLTEEDAVQEFRSKAMDEKYTAAAYKCTDCLKGFSEEDMLKRHIKIRHSECQGSIECQFCRMRFKRKCRLRQHIREHYTKFKCLRCNFVCVLESTALSHEQFHNGITRKCKYCGKEFRYSSTYYTHLRTHRSQHVCALCGSSFVSEAGLHQHKRVKHCTRDKTFDEEDKEEANKFCSRCNIKFETAKAYEEHLYHSTLHADENDTENNSKTNDLEERTVQEQATSLFKRRKIDDISLKSGKRCKKPTSCHQCGRHFSTQAACMRHHLEEHPGTSFCPPNLRHICEICGASLAPGSVAVHKNMHTREKIFACSTCGRQFYESVGLKRHMLTHTGEKPFACSSCDKRFTQSASLKLHYRTFHLKQPYPKRNRRKKE